MTAGGVDPIREAEKSKHASRASAWEMAQQFRDQLQSRSQQNPDRQQEDMTAVGTKQAGTVVPTGVTNAQTGNNSSGGDNSSNMNQQRDQSQISRNLLSKPTTPINPNAVQFGGADETAVEIAMSLVDDPSLDMVEVTQKLLQENELPRSLRRNRSPENP